MIGIITWKNEDVSSFSLGGEAVNGSDFIFTDSPKYLLYNNCLYSDDKYIAVDIPDYGMFCDFCMNDGFFYFLKKMYNRDTSTYIYTYDVVNSADLVTGEHKELPIL